MTFGRTFLALVGGLSVVCTAAPIAAKGGSALPPPNYAAIAQNACKSFIAPTAPPLRSGESRPIALFFAGPRTKPVAAYICYEALAERRKAVGSRYSAFDPHGYPLFIMNAPDTCTPASTEPLCIGTRFISRDARPIKRVNPQGHGPEDEAWGSRASVFASTRLLSGSGIDDYYLVAIRAIP